MNKTKVFAVFLPSLIFTGIIWLTYFADIYFHLNLWRFGLYPGKWSGLSGILTMPFIHGGLGHIINNTAPLIILTTFLFQFYNKFFFRVFIYIWLTSGLWTWVFARPSFHIGASGIIYGLAAFIFFAGIIIKEKRHIAISFLVVFLYGGIIWGMFPIDLQQSWEGHLTGFLAGTILAYFYKKELKQSYLPEVIIEDEDDENDDDEDAYWKSNDTSSIM